ncbi:MULTISPECIES: hypothetical protein [Streptomyces]|uniref:hypothetical protein n=1 Tax=Streptomyces TaxID=1883 RepID=UPI00067CAB62|nr:MULTISPECIES: hypothetical protein [Streptomyces]KOU53691.1 hypothetical protein ADK56_05095 [Streptomyces sp. MMG1522]MBD3553713.1 hypothetical protein [Streptomyces sp. SP18CM02]MDP9951693.1 hypothetical protein [Streptomyces sp. DSM 41269]QSS92714.1 hypothetical protein H3V39_21640 [Streptomyces sp. M54]
MVYRDFLLRRRCRAVLRNFDFPQPFSLDAFCRHLEERRRRPIHLHAVSMQRLMSGVYGLWLATETDDHFFYESQTSPLHQEHIVLHEIGHMLFGHATHGGEGGTTGWATALFPDLDPRLLRHALARSNFSTRHEREAEIMASEIRARSLSGVDRRSGNVVARLEEGLGLDGPHSSLRRWRR